MSAERRPAWGRRRRRIAETTAILLVVFCTGCTDSAGGEPAAASSPAAPSSRSAPREPALPEAEEIPASPEPIPASPYPDYAMAVDDLVWVANVKPGLVAFDATSGKRRFEVPTGRIKVAMDHGLGALWVMELASSGNGMNLLRIDPATGEVLSRTPTPGVVPNSSLAITEDAVWALCGFFEEQTRTLARFRSDGTYVDQHPAPSGGRAVRGGFGSLWVTAAEGVVRMDPSAVSPEATIPTGRGPGALTVTEDGVWVLNTLDGTVSRIDPETDEAVTTVTVSDSAVSRGDIVAGGESVWVRTTHELATEIDTATGEVVRVLGPSDGQGGIAVAEAAVWITANAGHLIYRVPR